MPLYPYTASSQIPDRGAVGEPLIRTETGAAARKLIGVELNVPGDGSTDVTATLQAAASTPNSQWLLPAGTHRITASLNFDASNVRFTAVPGAIINAPAAAQNTVNIAAGVSGVILENVTLDGLCATHGAQNVNEFFLGTDTVNCQLINCGTRNARGVSVCARNGSPGLRIVGGDYRGPFTAGGGIGPGSTTTVLRLFPGTAYRFEVGMAVSVTPRDGGAPTNRVVGAKTAIYSQVATDTSTLTAITVNSGTGANFTAGQVVRVGCQVGTILSVVGDVITFTAALQYFNGTETLVAAVQLPCRGDIVAVDTLTLTVALSAVPTLPAKVCVAGAANYGLFFQASGATRVFSDLVVERVRVTGHCQAAGFWPGVRNAKMVHNHFVDNIGFLDTTHTTIRSVFEEYGDTEGGGLPSGTTPWAQTGNVVSFNTIEGASSACAEIALGTRGFVFTGNTLRNWGSSLGISAGGNAAIAVGGLFTEPKGTDDSEITGNLIYGNGANRELGITFVQRSNGVRVAGNHFIQFSHPSSIAILIESDGRVSYTGNVFRNCKKCFLIAQSPTVALPANYVPGTIDGNHVYGTTLTSIFVYFDTSYDGWTVSNNTLYDIMAALVDGISGARHRILNNNGGTIRLSTNDHTIRGNRLMSRPYHYSAVVIDETPEFAPIQCTGGTGWIIEENELISRDDTGFPLGSTIFISTGGSGFVVQNNRHRGIGVTPFVAVQSGTTANARLEGGYIPRHAKTLGRQTVVNDATPKIVSHGLGATPTGAALVGVDASSYGAFPLGPAATITATDATNITISANAGEVNCVFEVVVW